MKKIFYTAVLSFLALPSYAAVNCSTTPSCSELGYTHSASECSGYKVVKCPFDKTKLFCAKPLKKANYVPCAVGMIYNATAKKCTGVADIQDPINGDEWIITDTTSSGKCTMVGATKYTGAQVVEIYAGQEVDEYEDAQNAGDEGCYNLFDAGIADINDIKFATIQYGNTAAFNLASDVYVVGGGKCFTMNGDIVDCPQGKTYAYYCKKRNVTCGSTTTESVFDVYLSPNPNCATGQYYNPTTKQCGTATTNYFVLSNGKNGLRTAYVGTGHSYVTTTKGTANIAKSQGYDYCSNNNFDNDLLTTAEIELLYNKTIGYSNLLYSTTPSNGNKGGSDIYYVVKDYSGCVDTTILGADSYSCPSEYYTIVCPKTFTK